MPVKGLSIAIDTHINDKLPINKYISRSGEKSLVEQSLWYQMKAGTLEIIKEFELRS